MKKRSWLLWFLAILITLLAARYQRATGPTHPFRVKVKLGDREIKCALPRSHGGPGGQEVRILVPDTAVTGQIAWKHYPSNESWQLLPMQRRGDTLVAVLPHQPPAGKLQYEVKLRDGSTSVTFPEKPAIIRFKGHVPLAVLVPHILAMFLFMLFSNRAGLEALVNGPATRSYSFIAVALLVVGGFVLGPAVQYFAFGQWWTGIPFGWDLTDNKTLIALVFWLWALWSLRGRRNARWQVVLASLVTLVIFLIPHSAWGSQLDWEKLETTTGPPK
ncbi:MAG: hypothetical protein GXO73_13065 [Calditrichaeota bacterium]|nr:hypothetical protein [Calditrichota bacterium]